MLSILDTAQDYLKHARGILFYDEDAKLDYIRDTYAADDTTARSVLVEAYHIAYVDRDVIRTTKKSDKSQPRCGYCAVPFATWTEAWEHERTAHAMEQRLYSKD
jgi:hypothetical protein